MKTVHAQNNVALMAQQFQNLVKLGHDTPPPPPQSQPPADEVIDSMAFSRTESTSGVRQEMHLSQSSQDHQRQLQYGPSGHLAQLVLHHHQQQPMSEGAITSQHQQLEVMQRDLVCQDSYRLAVPQVEHTGEKLTGIARLLNDLQRLLQDQHSADIVFLVGSNELPVYAHRAILRARCNLVQNAKPTELYKIFASTGSSSSGNDESVIRWPQAKPAVLCHVLQYVYTGKVTVQEKDIFEAWAIGSELGLDELVLTYEEHITASLNVHNACQYLDTALGMQQRLNENEWNKTVQMCMRFFSQNAADCVKTQAFVNLSKSGMTHLVSSNYFSLDEADVFRCVLTWAKHQTGVVKATQYWSEEERSRVSEQLSGVINHIRILLIDSQVFAEEVEPTGVVPIELSLQRYRFAALAGSKQAHHASTKPMQPRMVPTFSNEQCLFANSKLLGGHASADKLEQVLNAWYGAPRQSWKLLFRASSHEFSADAFHNHCDGVAPTYILILSSQDYLSGGFSDIPWSRGKGRGRYATSEKAFLFTLHSRNSAIPVRFDLKKKMFAIAHHANFGPVFGAGADLSISDQCHLNDASYSNLPHSYDGEDASSSSLFGDYNFTVTDYEVFTLAD